jgi:carboxymethylenebutenolidase
VRNYRQMARYVRFASAAARWPVMSASVATQSVTLSTPDGPMVTYDAMPAGELGAAGRGGVLVIQEAFGVNDHIEDVTRRAAAAGYRALAPHIFHRTGDPQLSYDDLPAVVEHMQALTMNALLSDLDACVDYLRESAGLAPDRIGVVGFCMGGSVTVLAAARRRLGAAVSFYGGGVAEGRFGMPPLVDLAPEFVTPWLGLYGGQDKGIPVDQTEALRDAALQSSVRTDLVLYPEAQHGFHCDARPSAYDKAAATDAWGRALGWLDEHLAQPR